MRLRILIDMQLSAIEILNLYERPLREALGNQNYFKLKKTFDDFIILELEKQRDVRSSEDE